MYEKIGRCDGVADLHGYGIVKIDGQEDSTASFIRCGLVVQDKPRCIEADQLKAAEKASKSRASDHDSISPETE